MHKTVGQCFARDVWYWVMLENNEYIKKHNNYFYKYILVLKLLDSDELLAKTQKWTLNDFIKSVILIEYNSIWGRVFGATI